MLQALTRHRHRVFAAAAWAVLLLIALAGTAAAQTVYRTVDEHGRVRYSDRPPADGAPAEALKFRAERGSTASIRYGDRGAAKIAYVRNHLAGPIEIELSLGEPAPIIAEPALPYRLVIPGSSEREATALRLAQRSEGSSFSLRMRAVPGSPRSSHEDVLYQLPLAGSNWRLSQGFNGRFTHHDDESKYAIDLACDEGTPVLAAREGVVMQVENHFEGSGLSREKFGDRANQIRLLHDDGSMALYAHLRAESQAVRIGSRVRPGQPIAECGNTGFSSGPHLHFAIQRNTGMKLESLPFRMQGLDLGPP